MSAPKAKLLCNFGGEFTRQLGKLNYMGGKTRLVLVDRSVSFDELRSKLSQLTRASPLTIEIKYQLPDESLESRLVSVDCQDDVVAMMNEFEASLRIHVYIFVADHNRVGDGVSQASVDSSTSPALSELVNARESHALMVGQEFPDASCFRDALVASAIALKFELTFIRSDRSRVTARCAADGCQWRIHASKLPDGETFQIKTLKGIHSCVWPERSSHRQANMKWILSCIMDQVRENVNYKPKEIMRDIEREYGVMIPYLKAHRAKERALELIYGMPIKDIVLNQAEVHILENDLNTFLDPRKKKPLKGSSVHCNLCKKAGHNRRSCLKLSRNESQAASMKEKNFHCMLCKQSGHNRRTCQCGTSLDELVYNASKLLCSNPTCAQQTMLELSPRGDKNLLRAVSQQKEPEEQQKHEIPPLHS